MSDFGQFYYIYLAAKKYIKYRNAIVKLFEISMFLIIN